MPFVMTIYDSSTCIACTAVTHASLHVYAHSNQEFLE